MSEPLDFGFDDETASMRDQARKLLDERGALPRLRALVAKDHEVYERGEPSGWDREAWSTMVELGFPSLPVPESAGGIGGSTVAITAIVEQLGAHAFPSPLIASASSAFVLRQVDSAASKAALEKIANGSIVALACFDTSGELEPSRSELVATRAGDGLRLDGTVSFVQDGGKAESFVVVARGDAGAVIAVVDAGASGLTVTADRIVDLTRDQVHLTFASVSVPSSSIVATGDVAKAALDRATPALLTLVAADLVGISEWQLRTTVEYAKVREQFDKAIGSFQAVKHPLVDMMIGIDQARSLVYAAASAFDHTPERAELLARMAKAKASDVGRYCSNRSVQLHGGIGFTWECDVHLFFKRSEHDQVLFGDGALQRARIATLLAD